MQHSAVRKSFFFATIVVVALSLASPASAHTPQGTTWWSNGTQSMGTVEGGTVRAYAVGARPGVGYVLTIGQRTASSTCATGARR